MKNNLYVIRDLVADESGPVFEARNHGVALRNMDKLLGGMDHLEEFQLFVIGSIDHDKDTIVVWDKSVVMPNVIDEVDEDE